MNPAPRNINSKRNLIIIIVAVVLLVVGILFQVLSNQQEADITDTNTEENTNVTTDDEEDNKEASILDPIAKARDLDRVNDIQTLLTSLESYFIDSGQYPAVLDYLTPDYLGSVPSNPEPGGKAYSYTPIGVDPYNYFDLCYSLETDGIEGIEAGDHCASPDGLVGLL